MDIKRDWISALLILVMLGGVFLFGVKQQPTEMGLLIVACSICLAFSNIDKIQKFKGAGFEAEMKKAVEEAFATTENLRSIAKPLILSTLDNLTYAGRWGGMDNERKHKLEADIERLAKSVGVFDEEVKSASKTFFVWHALDHIPEIEKALTKNNVSIPPDLSERLRSLGDRRAGKTPTVQELREVLKSLPEDAKQAIEPYIEDYKYYIKEKKLRRPKSSG